MQEVHRTQLEQNLRQGVNKLYPRQVRELYMAMESRAARKAIRAKYRLTRAQWEWLCEEWTAYMESQGNDDNHVSVRRLNILDKFTNSRLARALLRDNGPKPEAWWRKIKREWNAYRGNNFGTKAMNVTLSYVNREHRNLARQKRTVARKSQLARKHLLKSLHHFLSWTDAGRRMPQPLTLSAMVYFEMDTDGLRAYHQGQLIWARTTVADYVLLLTNTMPARNAFKDQHLSLIHI